MESAILTNGYSWIYGLVNLQHAYMNVLPVILLFAWGLWHIHCFTVTNRETINTIHIRIKDDWCIEYDDGMRPSGVVLHRPNRTTGISLCDIFQPISLLRAYAPRYIVYKHGCDRVIYVYTTKWYMHNVLLGNVHVRQTSRIEIQPVFDKDSSGQSGGRVATTSHKCESHQIDYMCRTGDAHYIRYKVRKINLVKYCFKPMQVELYKACVAHYNKHSATVMFLEGPVGTGKTCFAFLLAKQLNTCIVDAFNPTEPSDTFDNLYSSVEHTAPRPLIVLLDEVDVLLQNVCNGIPLHKNCLTQVRNKTQWNALLDKIQMGCYPNVVVVMCSNTSRKDIDTRMDPSLLRDGRVNLHYRMEFPCETI